MALTILDAGVVIAVLDGSAVHHDAATVAIAAAIGRGDESRIRSCRPEPARPALA